MMGIDYFSKFSSLPWLEKNTIIFGKAGSHSYGTATPESDLDVKGIAIPPKDYFLGFHKSFDQAVGNEPDICVYDIRKFMNLACEGNPNILEMLYLESEDYFKVTPIGEKLIEIRDKFLSKKLKHSYSGYSISQIHRIKGHRRWLLNPPLKDPTREDFGLPERALIPKEQYEMFEAMIKKQIDEWNLDYAEFDDANKIAAKEKIAAWMREVSINSLREPAAKAIGIDDNLMLLLEAERKYRAAKTEWKQYQEWKIKRNPKRAELEAKFGFDLKHAMHLVRLMRTCREILETGKLLVKRPDAEELLAIRNGAWTYEQIVEFAEKEDKDLNQVMLNSKLPKQPDRAFLDQKCIELVEESIRLNG